MPPARRPRCSSRRRSAATSGRAGPARPRASSCRRCPTLLDLASQMEAQRDHVLGKPHRESLGDDESPSRRRRSEPTRRATTASRSLGADAELDQVIFDGSSFGTATPAGSEEEADYLGIPGPARRRADARPVAAQAGRTADQDGPADAARCRAVSTHGQLRELRRELNALVSIAHHRTGKPHGWIHNELRRICGGPPIAAATTDQLKARIEAVHDYRPSRASASSARCFSELSRCATGNGGNSMSRSLGAAPPTSRRSA